MKGFHIRLERLKFPGLALKIERMVTLPGPYPLSDHVEPDLVITAPGGAQLQLSHMTLVEHRAALGDERFHVWLQCEIDRFSTLCKLRDPEPGCAHCGGEGETFTAMRAHQELCGDRLTTSTSSAGRMPCPACGRNPFSDPVAT